MYHENNLYAFGASFKVLALHNPPKHDITTGFGNPPKLKLNYPAVVKWKRAVTMRLPKGKGFTFLHIWKNLWIMSVDCSSATDYTCHVTMKVFIHLLSHPLVCPRSQDRDYGVKTTWACVFSFSSSTSNYSKEFITLNCIFLTQRKLESYSGFN